MLTIVFFLQKIEVKSVDYEEDEVFPLCVFIKSGPLGVLLSIKDLAILSYSQSGRVKVFCLLRKAVKSAYYKGYDTLPFCVFENEPFFTCI